MFIVHPPPPPTTKNFKNAHVHVAVPHDKWLMRVFPIIADFMLTHKKPATYIVSPFLFYSFQSYLIANYDICVNILQCLTSC